MAPSTRKTKKAEDQQAKQQEEAQKPQDIAMEEAEPKKEHQEPEEQEDADVEDAGEEVVEEEDTEGAEEEEAEGGGEEEEEGGGEDEEEEKDEKGGESGKDEEKERTEKDEAKPAGGKIFIGGLTWETTAETLQKHFEKYGKIIDSVIMKNRKSGHPRGFGFVTFSDPSVCDKVLADTHVIDGRTVEAKRTVPREKMDVIKGPKTKKIFVGGLSVSTTEEELKSYFSKFGKVVEHQIMQAHGTGRSRGFGFVMFDSEQVVEDLLLDEQTHEIGGKQVEIKKAEPKRAEPPPFRRSSGPVSGRRGSAYSADVGFYGSYMGDPFYGGGFNSRGGRGGDYPYGGAYGYGGGPYGYGDFSDSYGRYGYNYSGYGYDYGYNGSGGRGYDGGSGRYHPYGR